MKVYLSPIQYSENDALCKAFSMKNTKNRDLYGAFRYNVLKKQGGFTNMQHPKPGIYRHFKGNEYELLEIVRHSETQEEMILYKALYGDFGLWVRPLSMWLETVKRDGYEGPRFAFIRDK